MEQFGAECGKGKTFRIALPWFRLKKWSGGMVIIALAVILFFSYSFRNSPPKKQTAYEFFRNHPRPDSHFKDTHGARPEVNKVTKPSKQWHPINVEGLDDLYAPNNVSKEESKPLLVWGQMRLLLSRSDALTKTAQGIKEASIAWKELLSVIEEDKVAKYKNCPYSVSTINKKRTSNGTILEIPCGLVEDSSITIVGIPDARNGSFQIELRSSQLIPEENPSIILHYKVRLPGNNMTAEPFIVQNSWTAEHGWGKEERCPAHRSTNKKSKVDGLVLCNEQVVRSTIDDHSNGSHPGSDIQANVSQGTSHASSNFPFAEGNAFTATLWVGSEGFHMTVNGRHETSFAFREKLEPWAVSGVRVDGMVNILSSLAKGLPVSEDHDLVAGIGFLKAPPVRKKRLAMLIGVFSTGNNFERRMALRRSWMQYEAVRSGDVAVRFFIGLHKNSRVNFELWKEAQAYGDVQLMPFVDYYSLISLKTIAICIMGTKILPAKYIMKTDDDAFVRIDEVLSSLKGKSSSLLHGLISYDSSPHRDMDSKWYISEKEWPHSTYPPWAHGPGYVVSRDIAKFIVQGHQEGDLKLFKLEDVAMGIWIEEFRKSVGEVNYMTDDRFYNAGCESDYILAHYQNPRLLLCLWDRLQREHQPGCCE